jgi:hypothetical protein
MFTLTRSSESVVVTLVPKSTVPPLPYTFSDSSATARMGVVTDDLGVVDVVGDVDVVDVGGAIGELGVSDVVEVLGSIGAVAAAPVADVKFRKLAATVSELVAR